MNKPLRIYVAGALNANSAVQYIKNVRSMIDVAVALKRKGHYPYVPCLDILLGLVAGNWDYGDYAGLNIAFVPVCEALFLINHSPGATVEYKRARELGLIIYRKLEEVPDAV
jgi:hypothetical protein